MTETDRLAGADTAQAFGITFALGDRIDLAGLPQALGDPAAAGAPTTIRHDPAAVRAAARWRRPTRVREVRHGDRLLLSVDRCEPHGYLFCTPGVGSALIATDGLDVRCAPEVQNAAWSAVLVGQVLPLVATLRGLEVFHAAGVVIEDQAQLLLGPSGVGKTSLAAHLVNAGAGLLSDDVIAIDDDLTAHPGTSVLHVREPEAELVSDVLSSRLRPLGPPGADGDRARFIATALAGARPLGRIYLLERAAAGPAIQRVPAPRPFDLLGATFNLSVQTPARLTHHLELCGRIAERVPVFRVRIRPGHRAAELAAELLEHGRSGGRPGGRFAVPERV